MHLYEKLFSFKLENNMKIYCSQNELYIQFLMYVLFSYDKDVLILTSNLNEANKVYVNLKSYISNIYLFPEDDFLTKKAIAASPELLQMRMQFINSVTNSEKKVLICHLNSFLKRLPKLSTFKENSITLSLNESVSRDEIINKLNKSGYVRESIATNIGEYAIRGFIIDVYPINEESPVRIEFFGDDIDRISYFDENTQLSKENINSITIKPCKDEFDGLNASIIEYLNSPLLIYQDKNQLERAYASIKNQIEYYNDENLMFGLDDIKSDFNMYVDTIDNYGKYNYLFVSESINTYNNDYKSFVDDINNNTSFIHSKNANFIKRISKDISKSKIVNEYLNSGFIYEGVHYFCENDLLRIANKSKFDLKYKYGKKIESLESIKVGDYVVHKVNGIGIYAGINTITRNGIKKDYILIKYQGNDKLYLPVDDIDKLYKYSSKEGSKPKIYKLNSVEWQKTKLKIKNNIKSITDELLKIYKNRNVATVEPFSKDNELQLMFEQEFEYEETADQLKVIREIKQDLESSHPMDRLLCGDVGYGKTEVIFRAMFKTILNNKQVLYLCPTTLLSAQQYESAIKRFRNFGVNIELLNRHTSLKTTKRILDGLKAGKVDAVIGTHRLLSKDVVCKDLGLLVIDEEQRFGVMHKEKIKEMKSNVHVLSVSATPIPRSLQMSLVGLRDLSLIETAPKNRYPVQTYVIKYDIYLVREMVMKELERGGQIFILYNKIESMEKLVESYKKLIPEARIAYAHGQTSKEKMQEVMESFRNCEYDVLVSTTIIENGIDIPNANTIIIIDADKFGLSQLYQIRGRVGRNDRIAYAYLMYNGDKILNETAVKRLDAIKEFTELNSGYKISMRDLSIRGAGDLLGREQAGFIDSVGVNMYLDLVNENINNVDSAEEKASINLDDVETHIGEEYTTDEEVIILIHRMINGIKSYDDLLTVKSELNDRFGHVNEKLEIYMYQTLLDVLINKLGVEMSENSRIKVSINIFENTYKNINVEDVFIQALSINSKFKFIYKNNYINISLLKANLDKHYIFYIVDLLLFIDDQIKSKA